MCNDDNDDVAIKSGNHNDHLSCLEDSIAFDMQELCRSLYLFLQKIML